MRAPCGLSLLAHFSQQPLTQECWNALSVCEAEGYPVRSISTLGEIGLTEAGCKQRPQKSQRQPVVNPRPAMP